MSFQGKTVLITGAGSGMGRLAARNMAAAGAKVAALDVNEAGLAETAEGHDSIRSFVVDVTDAAHTAEVVRETESEIGPIARVYNAAAIMPLGKLLDQDTALIRKIMDINYGGVVNIAKATLPPMLERGSGDMIIFASMAGWLPTIYMGAYNASKFAVVAFAEVLYHENQGRGVRFACVCPPPVNTPLLAQGRDTVWPKLLDEAPPIEPQEVLDSIDRTLADGSFWVFPGKGTKAGWFVRRFAPGLLWKRIHKVEGV
jgi:NAD(P)-dependent dehydrogenase (short-subunit alcohol dehydrogenase family)